jgi:hypothetical protein
VSEGYCLSMQAPFTWVLPLASTVTVLQVNWPAAVQAALLSSTLPPRLVHSDVVSGTAVVVWMTPVTGLLAPVSWFAFARPLSAPPSLSFCPSQTRVERGSARDPLPECRKCGPTQFPHDDLLRLQDFTARFPPPAYCRLSAARWCFELIDPPVTCEGLGATSRRLLFDRADGRGRLTCSTTLNRSWSRSCTRVR